MICFVHCNGGAVMVDRHIDTAAGCKLNAGACAAPAGKVVDDDFVFPIFRVRCEDLKQLLARLTYGCC
jgi:hypothetical protein